MVDGSVTDPVSGEKVSNGNPLVTEVSFTKGQVLFVYLSIIGLQSTNMALGQNFSHFLENVPPSLN